MMSHLDRDERSRIVVERLAKSFVLHTQGGVRLDVLGDTNLTVSAGECVVLTGDSGSGKSTLLRCLYGNYQPTDGRVSVRHQGAWIDVTRAEPAAIVDLRLRSVGWVSQFLRVIPRVAALQIVAEPAVARGWSVREAEERARSLLTRLNVPERLWSLAPATFSGGEQQRVNVARGIAAEHPILLVDEPTASLDADNREVVVELLIEARERGAAIVGIFHDAHVRERVATRFYDVATSSPVAVPSKL
jgi:alpha-D-ribose 1-methylphosphonate 5-triphosphate synthase subunit PhnL